MRLDRSKRQNHHPAMRIGRLWIATAIAVAALAGVAQGAGLGLAQRVVRSGDFAGMKVAGPPVVAEGAAGFAAQEQLSPSALRTETARLKHLDFVAGAHEQLVSTSNGNASGLSAAEQFSSAASAKAELAHEASANGPWKYFAVPGIPGARGFGSTGNSGGGANVAFTDGPVYYLVGAGWSGGAANAVKQGSVIAAARAVYRRVHGKPLG
jgi:hypothetical protein